MKFDNSDLEHLSDAQTAKDGTWSKQPSPSQLALYSTTTKKSGEWVSDKKISRFVESVKQVDTLEYAQKRPRLIATTTRRLEPLKEFIQIQDSFQDTRTLTGVSKL